MAHFRERIGKDGKVTYQANIRRRGAAHKGRSFDTIEEAKRSAASANRYAHMITERKRTVLALAMKPSIAPEIKEETG